MLRVARKIPWYRKWTVPALHMCSALVFTALTHPNITGAFESKMALALVVPLYELQRKTDTTDSETGLKEEPADIDRSPELYRSRDSPRDVNGDRMAAIDPEQRPLPSIGASGLTVLLLAGVLAMLSRLSK